VDRVGGRKRRDRGSGANKVNVESEVKKGDRLIEKEQLDEKNKRVGKKEVSWGKEVKLSISAKGRSILGGRETVRKWGI